VKKKMNKFNEKSRAAYNKIADDYDNSPDGKFTVKFKKLLLSTVTLRENYNVLDVACGNGTLLAAMKKQKAIKGFGIDISERMIKNAAALNPGMEFQAAGCEAVPFQNNSMDIITVCAAYHHFPDAGAFAGEAERLLKRGGKIYIADIYLPSLLRIICNPFVPLLPAGDVKFYSPKAIIKNFSRHGFEKIDVMINGNVQIISMRKT
jgi:ubiquinone/menaquinone biosynthesis C-methylase UbiE